MEEAKKQILYRISCESDASAIKMLSEAYENLCDAERVEMQPKYYSPSFTYTYPVMPPGALDATGTGRINPPLGTDGTITVT